jgi:acetylornithine/succinyldiaminopimelate/putrescine aminotransferase
MALLDATLDIGMTAIAGACGYLALHSADPGTTGANPTSAARVAATWSTSTNGDIVTTNKAFTGGAASGAVLYVGFWSAATGGTFRGSQIIPTSAGNDLAFNAAGNYTLNSVAINSAAS